MTETMEHVFRLSKPCRAAFKGDWDAMKKFYEKRPGAISRPLTVMLDTALHIAVYSRDVNVVKYLLQIGPDLLTKKNIVGNNVLHEVATIGDVKIAEALLEEPNGLNLVPDRNNLNETPLFCAAAFGKTQMMKFLASKVPRNEGGDDSKTYSLEGHLRRTSDSTSILHVAILGQYFETAWELLKMDCKTVEELDEDGKIYLNVNSKLAELVDGDGMTCLHILANLPSAFKSGTPMRKLEKILYYLLPDKAQTWDFTRTTQDIESGSRNPILRLRPKKALSTTTSQSCTLVLYCSYVLNRVHSRMSNAFWSFMSKGCPTIQRIWDLKKKHELVEKIVKILAPTELSWIDSNNGLQPERISIDPSARHEGKNVQETQEVFPNPFGETYTSGDGHGTTPFHFPFEESESIGPKGEETNNIPPKPLEETDTNRDGHDTTSSSSTLKEFEGINSEGQETHNDVPPKPSNGTDIFGDSHGTTTFPPKVAPRQEVSSMPSEEIYISKDGRDTPPFPLPFPLEEMGSSGTTPLVNHGNIPPQQQQQKQRPRLKKNETPLLAAARNGIIEIVKAILDVYPQAVDHVNDKGENILHVVASQHRQEVFNYLQSPDIPFRRLTRRIDSHGNSLLHHAAVVGHFRARERPGEALHMQADIQWFKRVKKIIPPHFMNHRNDKRMTAQELFTKKHKKVVKEGEEWLTRTSESCSLVAVLMATVAFTSALTVPGGPNQTTGHPLLLEKSPFVVFTISDILSLSFALTSVVVFLSIMTSRFDERDFHKSLPLKLVLGLTTLFLSVAAMMVAFAATLVLMMQRRLHWAAIPIYFLACYPVTIFLVLQFPLYLHVAWFTLKDIFMMFWRSLPCWKNNA